MRLILAGILILITAMVGIATVLPSLQGTQEPLVATLIVVGGLAMLLLSEAMLPRPSIVPRRMKRTKEDSDNPYRPPEAY